MTKSIAIIFGSILLVSLGIFSVIQVKKLSNTKTNLTEQLINVQTLEESLQVEKDEKDYLAGLNSDLQFENEMLRDSIEKLHMIIAELRKKVQTQDQTIAELRKKIIFLQQQYDQKKQEIAMLSRKEEVDQEAIAQIETEKAEIKEQINNFQSEESNAFSIKLVTENQIQDKMDSEERFRKIVDVVNNTRIKFQGIQIKMDPTGKPVSRLISDGKNWKHTSIEFFMNHSNNKVLLDEQFLVKIIDMDFQEEISFVQPNPMVPEDNQTQEGAPFYFDGNLVEINHINSEPKKGKNFEVQVFYKSDDGEEYLLLDGVKQFIRDGNIVGL